MKRFGALILLFWSGLSLLFLFQNCGVQKPFQLHELSSLSSRSQSQIKHELSTLNEGDYSALRLISYSKLAQNKSTAATPSIINANPKSEPFPPGDYPEAPLFLSQQQFHEAEPQGRAAPQNYLALRPTIPPLRTSHDGRLGFGWGTGRLYLLSPEKITTHFPFSREGLDIVLNPSGEDSRYGWENFLAKPGEPWSFAGTTICNHASKQQQPRKCGPQNGNDCYDLTYMGFYTKRSDPNGAINLGYFRSRQVIVEVQNPKTTSAKITDIRVNPDSSLREKANPIVVDQTRIKRDFWSFEPVTTSDGRLYVSRMSGAHIKDVVGHGIKSLDIYYMVAPLSASPCDAASFTHVKNLPRAPFDPEMRDSNTGKARYGIAEYPMRDSFGRLIPEDGYFPTYPWIDREGNNLFFSTGGSTLYTFPWKFQEVPAAEPNRYIGDWVMLPESERYPSRCLAGFADCKQNRYNPEDRGGVRGYAVIGSWTRGKTILFDGMINHTDYGLKRGPRFNREIKLYQASGSFDGYVRVGSGREAGHNGNGFVDAPDSFEENSEILGMGGPTGTIDSLENIFNVYRFLRPTLPRDVVWTINNGIGSEEVAFDDSMDTRALVVSSMMAGAEFQTLGWYHDEWKYADGFSRRGDGNRDSADQPILIQNAATSEHIPLPLFGYLDRGRVEPVASGGVHGRGLWLDGSNSLTYRFPQSLGVLDLFFSVFFDNRSLDDQLRQLVEFPDGSRILVSTAEIQLQRGNYSHSISLNSPKRSWRHLALGITKDGRTIDFYVDGMKYSTVSPPFSIFTLSGTLPLRAGKNSGTRFPGFRGWIDELKLFSYIPTPEVICNHAFGSLHWVKPQAKTGWHSRSEMYPGSTHSEIYQHLPQSYLSENGIPGNGRFVCTTDYSGPKQIYRALLRENEGLLSIRDALLFAVPKNGSVEDGRLAWNTNRVDYRGNQFCLSCHSPAERRGLTLAALEPGNSCTMTDRRRQPLQPPLLLSGHLTNMQLNAISSQPNSLLKTYDSASRALLTDPMLLITAQTGATCGNVSNSGQLADLVVTDISYLPQAPVNGDLVTVVIHIRNQGSLAVPKGSWIGATITNNDNSVGWAGATLTAPLATGASIQILTPEDQRLRAVAGTHSISVRIDDQNRVKEVNEGNNQFTKSLVVLNKEEPPPPPSPTPTPTVVPPPTPTVTPAPPVTPPKPSPTPTPPPVTNGADLLVTKIQFSPEQPKVGALTEIHLTVKNQGNQTVRKGAWLGATLRLTSGNTVHWTWAGALLHADLGAGASTKISTPAAQRWTVSPGAWTVMSVIDDQKGIIESNEDNNTSHTPVSFYSVQVTRKPNTSYSLDLVLTNGRVIQACLHDWIFPSDSSPIVFNGVCDNGAIYDMKTVTELRLFYSIDRWLSAKSVSKPFRASTLQYSFTP